MHCLWGFAREQSDLHMEETGTVSLWLGTVDSASLLDAYMEIAYSEDGDFLGSGFSKNFGIEYYDDDFKECECVDRSRSIAQLLSGFSYDATIVPGFEELWGKELDEEVNAVVLLYNFRYSGSVKRAGRHQISLEFKGFVRYGP